MLFYKLSRRDQLLSSEQYRLKSEMDLGEESHSCQKKHIELNDTRGH